MRAAMERLLKEHFEHENWMKDFWKTELIPFKENATKRHFGLRTVEALTGALLNEYEGPLPAASVWVLYIWWFYASTELKHIFM